MFLLALFLESSLKQPLLNVFFGRGQYFLLVALILLESLHVYLDMLYFVLALSLVHITTFIFE